jgi:hypothetical protein
MDLWMHRSYMVLGKKALVVGASTGAGVVLVLLVVLRGAAFRNSPVPPRQSWNQNAIKATYVGSQLRQIDRSLAGLSLSYDLENNTDRDYRLADGPGVFIMSRLKFAQSLSQEELIRLSYPIFLPANQRVRMAIEISHPFVWPAAKDPDFENKLRDFVRQRLAKVEGFVLFDDLNRCQVELPSAWQGLDRNAGAQN